jgi:hypothetical protein
VAKLSAADGSCLWSTVFSSDGPDTSVEALAVDPMGSILIAGGFTGTLTVPGLRPARTGAARDPMLLKLNSAGSAVWLRTAEASGSGAFTAVAVAADGFIAVGGGHAGSLTLDDGRRGLHLPAPPAQGLFAALLNPKGVAQWGRSAPTSGGVVLDVVFDTAGAPVFVGAFHDDLGFGSTLTSVNTWYDAFVLKLKRVSGAHRWSVRPRYDPSTPTLDEWVGGIALTPAGNLGIVGPSAGETDGGVFVDTLSSADGATLVEMLSTRAPFASGADIAVDPAGKLYVGGTFGHDSDTFSIGGAPPVTARGFGDPFVAQLKYCDPLP